MPEPNVLTDSPVVAEMRAAITTVLPEDAEIVSGTLYGLFWPVFVGQKLTGDSHLLVRHNDVVRVFDFTKLVRKMEGGEVDRLGVREAINLNPNLNQERSVPIMYSAQQTVGGAALESQRPPLAGSLNDLNKRCYVAVDRLEQIINRLRGAAPALAQNGLKDPSEPSVLHTVNSSHEALTRIENQVDLLDSIIG